MSPTSAHDVVALGTSQPSRAARTVDDGTRRRITHLDVLRPDGLDGPLEVVATGSDLEVVDGCTNVLADCRLTARIEADGVIEAVAVADGPDLTGLQGESIAAGFRRRAAAVLGEPDDPHRKLVGALLDDLPAAVFVSGYARGRAGLSVDAAAQAQNKVDICAGWRRDGTMMRRIESSGRLPMPVGPIAPAPETDDPGPAAFELPALPAHGLRRQRRIDVRPGAPIRVDSMFRDSHMAADHFESVLHEYELRVDLEPRTTTIVSARAEPRVLPWPECGDAASSARHLVGGRLAGLARAIRSELTGPATCTHLNDVMRALEGVEHLVASDVPINHPTPTGER